MQREPVVDKAKLRRLIAARDKSQTQLAKEMDIARGRLVKTLGTGEATPDTVRRLSKALGIPMSEILFQPAYQEKPQSKCGLTAPNDWKIDSIHSPCLIAANGVSYQVAKLENELTAGLFARGKFYNLYNTSPGTSRELSAKLLRHRDVCASLVEEPRIAKHMEVARMDEDTAWWVLDYWIEKPSLQSLLDSGEQILPATIQAIGTEILLALKSLHARRIIMRELAPERIFVDNDKQHCVLSDFEMAKLLDSELSVADKWRLVSPYRAPEIFKEDDECFRSDLYSWGVIMTEMLTGATELDESSLAASCPDNRVVTMITKCCHENFRKRPRSIAAMIKTWLAWKV